MPKIFLITKEGPEWNIPVEAWDTKEVADKRASALDEELKALPMTCYSTLSKHIVSEIELKANDESKSFRPIEFKTYDAFKEASRKVREDSARLSAKFAQQERGD